MKQICLLLLVLGSLSCSDSANKKSPTSSRFAPSTSLKRSEDSGPVSVTIAIDLNHKTCAADSDCQHIMTHCSCNCGDAVNKEHAQKYSDMRASMCEDSENLTCKISCDNYVVTCKDKQCAYDERT